MGVKGLLRMSVRVPLRVAAFAVNTTTAIVGEGVSVATAPVRTVAGLMSGLSDVHSPGALAAELLGAAPARRCSRTSDRAWIEVRGLHDRERAPQIADSVLSALRACPHVRAAALNFPLSRAVVTLEPGTPEIRDLCAAIEAAERTAGATTQRPRDLPGDAEVLAGRLVALAVSSAGLCAAVTGRVLPLPRLPTGAAAAVTIVDYQPRIRRLLEDRFGAMATDTALAVASSAVYTATQAWVSLGVDVLLHLLKAAESRSAQRTWERQETLLAEYADCRQAFDVTRPMPLSSGPIERHGDRSAVAQLIGATGIGVATGDPNAAATAAVVAAPKAARTARESFATTLARGLCDDHLALPLRPEALRRLDRVDAVVIDPRALAVDELRVRRIRGAPDDARAEIWRWAETRLAAGVLTPGWNRVGGAPDVNGATVEVLVRHAHHPLASAVIGESRAAGAKTVSLDVDELDDLRPVFDDLKPVDDLSLDVAMAAAVEGLQRDGRTVAVLSTAAPQALAAADVAIGLTASGGEPSWYADLLVDDLAAAWRVLCALPQARAASRRGVEISTAASLLGALLMVPGVRGRGPGPVTAGAAAGLWTGYSLARRVLRAPAPIPAPTHDWHAMSATHVRRLLPPPPDEPPARPSFFAIPSSVRSAGRGAGEFVATLRDEFSDPLTPILATGSAASAVLGSPVDAVLVGSVLVLNSALAATQQLHAHRLLRRLLAVQVPPARRVLADDAETLTYVDTDAARLRPGDVIEVRSGDVVPADARLIVATDLEVDESTLTGESFPVAKQLDATPGAVLAERSCMLFATTTVAAGVGRAVVTAVGPETQVRRAAEVPHGEGGAVGLQSQLREMTDRAWPVSLAGGALVSVLALTRRASLRQALASGVAVTVAAVPEGLALVATLAQQASARRLTKLGALVRSPRSIEALGRVDVVCFDKTGTLSENRLRVTTAQAAAGFSRVELLACAAAATPPPDDGGQYAHATDAAVAEAAGAVSASTTLAHLPFRSGRPFSATVSGDRLAIKGAPEVVLPACVHLDRSMSRAVRAMAADGLRVIAVAERTLVPEKVIRVCEDSDELLELCRGELRLVGLLGLADTARDEAAPLLAALAEQGIGVRLITGDHPVTAAAIATELGMPVTPEEVISGGEWEALSRRDQEQAVAGHVVFARMSPENKVQVVQTLERTGRVCAMVGDGANDVAAIRAATVGIGVASRGSDPARTAADVMLLDGHIQALLDALDEGRKLWLRVQAAVSVLLGGNAGEVAFAVIGSAITGRSPLSTRQLLLVNMLTDALPAAALAVSEPNGGAAVVRRGPDEAALWRTVGVRGATTAAGATLAWTMASLTGRQRRASTVALVALVATQLGQTILDSRSRLVVLTAGGSLATLGVLISTPGVSQLLGSTPLGPVGWAQALGSATAATAAAAVISRALAQRSSAPDRLSLISTMPARYNAAYSSHNGAVSTRATTSVNGSEGGRFHTVPTVTKT